MTNAKTTKKALLASALALVLCFSMLLGTTFAWFTDNVTSANNIIKSGDLDIELEYWDGNAWVDVSGRSDILTNELWEPGVTEVAYLRVANAGSLALKYRFGVNIISETAGVNVAGEEFNLSDFLMFDVVGIDADAATKAPVVYQSRDEALSAAVNGQKLNVGLTQEDMLESGDEFYLALIVYMPTTVGNEANHNGTNVPTIDLGINIDAAQVAFEEDTHGSDYDSDAVYQVFVDSALDLQLAVDAAEPGTEIVLEDDVTVTEPIVIPAPAVSTFALRSAPAVTVINLNGKTLDAAYAEGSTTNHVYAFTNNGNLLLKNGTVNARGIFNYGNMTVEDATINAIDGNGGYAVRNYAGSSFVMNSGKIATTLEDDHQVNHGGYDATTLRVDEGAKAVINGGVIDNCCDWTFAVDNAGEVIINDAVITSVHSTISNYGKLEINGGSFTCNGVEGVTAHVVVAWDGSTTEINGGSFNGKDNYNGFNVDADEGASVVINGGNFLPVHSGSLYGKGTIIVKGGVFFDKIADARLAAGCEYAQDAQGNWVVSITDLQTVINNAKAGDTIVLNNDVTAPSVVMIDKSIVIEGNGYKVSSSATRVFRVTAANVDVTLNNVNMVSNAVRVSSVDIRGISVDGDLTNISLTLNDCSVDFTDASAHDWAYAVNVAGGSGYVLVVNGGTYEGANVINVRGAGQTVVVKNATLTSLYLPSVYESMYGACIYVVQNETSSVEAVGNIFNGGNAVAINAGYTPVVESDNVNNTTRSN